MIDRRVADKNEIDPGQFSRLNRTTWILIEERIDQDVLAGLRNQLIGGYAEESNSRRHRSESGNKRLFEGFDQAEHRVVVGSRYPEPGTCLDDCTVYHVDLGLITAFHILQH